MKTAIIVLSDKGERTASKLCRTLGVTDIIRPKKKGELKQMVAGLFNQYEGLVFIMALGIVVRIIAPHLRNKHEDPAVVVVDEAHRFSISVLSGHERGANGLSTKVARCLDAEPVITTASDTVKKIILGIGCCRGVSSEAVKKAILDALNTAGIKPDEVRFVVSADIKRDETGLILACSDLNLHFRTINLERIRNFCGPVETSKIAMKHLKVKGVCEPCALIAGRNATLIMSKKHYPGITVALALEDSAGES